MTASPAPLRALLGAALLLATTAARAQAADPRDQPVLEACGSPDASLHKAALAVAQKRLRGEKIASTEELGALLRESGSTAPWPRSLVFVAQPVDRAQVALKARDFAKKLPARLPVRCGVASASDENGVEALVVLAAPAAARVAPFARQTRVGAWFTVDARVLVPATGAKIVVLGPSGAPRGIPTSFHKGRVQGRFAVDRPGRWMAQIVADLDGGPLPVAEIEVIGGEPQPRETTAVPGEGATGSDDEATLRAMINEARQSEGLTSLSTDDGLTKLARAHAAAMARKQLVGHDVGDGDPEQRAAAANLNFRLLGENVAHAGTLSRAHRALWSSPSHRQNLLTARFRKVGVAAARDADGTVWVAQLFADP